MIGDARTIASGTRIEADVCIVGAGAAGLTLAMELVGSPLGVILLEAGGRRPDRATQSLLRGESQGYGPLEEARLSCLGGTTRVWSGWCRPLGATDLQARDWVDEDGWPFERAHLDPFYERAQALCDLCPYDYATASWETESASSLRLANDLVQTAVFQLSPPTRFGRLYRGTLAAATNITVLQRAVATELVPAPSGQAIRRLEVATLSGRSFWVGARIYVLASGGIENPRLLLISDSVQAAGVGNDTDIVGRYFMEHPYSTSGTLRLSDGHPQLAFYWPHHVTRDGVRTKVRGVFVTAERARRERLLRCALLLMPPHYSHPSMSSEAAKALGRLALALRGGWLSPVIRDDFATAARDPVGATRALYHRMRRGEGAFHRTRRLHVRAFCEPLPRPSSRVRLTRERDRLGRRRVRLGWDPSELERRSMKRAHQLLDEALRQVGIGRVECTLDTAEEPPMETGFHHMGATRISRDRRRGVVDEDCRVHGVDNLFVAGSSVFPTAGFANPTLTIVALALRLADHIKSLLADGRVPSTGS